MDSDDSEKGGAVVGAWPLEDRESALVGVAAAALGGAAPRRWREPEVGPLEWRRAAALAGGAAGGGAAGTKA